MKHLDFTEIDSLEFARCQRPDGSYYGTSGQCRKGTKVGAKEKAELKKAAAKGNKRAKVALDVVEGKISKKDAAKALAAAARKEAKPKSVPPDMKKELAALSKTKGGEDDKANAAAMRKRYKESKKELGEGAYGAVKETAQGTVIKQGFIGKNEVEVQRRLADVDGVPKLINHAYTSAPQQGRNGDRKGFIEMEKAGGKDLITQQMRLDNPAVKGANATKIQNEYIRLRKDLHTRGVAHGDMHEGNVTWNGKKMGVLDFGLSTPTYKAALTEALGTFNRDPRAAFFFDGIRRDGANTAKANKLERKVEQIRKKAGGAITEKRAQQLIEELYDGF